MIFLIWNLFPLFSYVYFGKIGDFNCVLQSTRGFQSFYNNNDSGDLSNQSQILEFVGLNFYSFYKKTLFSKANLNLGFVKKPQFLWTQNPNFNYEDKENSSNLRCVEFDYLTYFFSHNYFDFYPFIGYSFVEYKGNYQYKDDMYVFFDNFFHSSISGGIQYFNKINNTLTFSSYISYSPMIYISKNEVSKLYHYFCYETEFSVNTRYMSVLLFFVYRNSFYKKSFFEKRISKFDSKEIGFSFRLKLF